MLAPPPLQTGLNMCRELPFCSLVTLYIVLYILRPFTRVWEKLWEQLLNSPAPPPAAAKHVVSRLQLVLGQCCWGSHTLSHSQSRSQMSRPCGFSAGCLLAVTSLSLWLFFFSFFCPFCSSALQFPFVNAPIGPPASTLSIDRRKRRRSLSLPHT